MAHLYDKAPPKYAKDPWAWDYTREKMEDACGRSYDKWEGRHFAGAANIYKNVVKKYGTNRAELTMPKECQNCGRAEQHYADDYVCRTCRDAIDNAPDVATAHDTIVQPDSIDAIRDALAEALGKPQAAPKPFNPNTADRFDRAARRDEIQAERAEDTETSGAFNKVGNLISGVANVSRNYKAMGDDKLRQCIAELEAGSGDAVKRAQAKGEDPFDHLEAALRAGQEKGL